MKYVILSDVHGNLEALDSVLQDINNLFPKGNCERIFLGDAVGYGPNPNEVLRELESNIPLPNWIAGNHDKLVRLMVLDNMAARKMIAEFNKDAATALRWTASVVKEDKSSLTLLEKLARRGSNISRGNLLFSHGAPHCPEEMRYVFSLDEAKYFFFERPQFRNITCFVGHTHSPQIYGSNGSEPVVIPSRKSTFGVGEYANSADLSKFSSALVVVPSVGQPRDNSTSTGYAVYDEDKRKVTFRRLNYNYKNTQMKMRAVNLPQFLIDRLGQGRLHPK